MKLKVITAVSDPNHPGVQRLEYSLKLFGYDYKILSSPNVNWGWGGWEKAYEWLKSSEANDYTHIIWTDGFDTLALAPPIETEQKLTDILKHKPDAFIYSVEKHWFPHEGGWEAFKIKFDEKVKDLPSTHRWRYVNGGQFAGSKEALINWFEKAPKERNNQAWANYYYGCENDGRLILDFNCELFQTISHSGELHGSPEEFEVEKLGFNRICGNHDVNINTVLKNNLTGSHPCFVHANGIKNPDEYRWMYKLLNIEV